MTPLKSFRKKMEKAGYDCQTYGAVYEFYSEGDCILALRQTLTGINKGQIWRRGYDDDFRTIWIATTLESLEMFLR